MVFRTLNGRERDISIKPYRVDWDRVVSKPQKAVKDFVRHYWEGDIVLEEFRIPGSRYRIDLLRIGSQSVVIEVSPESSHSYNPFFHGGSLNRFKDALKRDFKKADWARASGFVLVELTEADFPLTETAFARQGVIL